MTVYMITFFTDLLSRYLINVRNSVAVTSVARSLLYFTRGLTESTQGHKVYQVVLPE